MFEKRDEPDWSSFVPHLKELRSRVLKVLFFFSLCAVCLMPFLNEVFALAANPLFSAIPAVTNYGVNQVGEVNKVNLQAIHILSPIFTPIKVILYISAFLTMPLALYQFWAFAKPGLYDYEQNFVRILAFFSTLLFFSGSAFAYFFVLKKIFSFILNFAPTILDYNPEVGEYVSFVLNVIFAFGIGFQIPVIVIGLVGLDVVSYQKIKELRSYVIVFIFLCSALLTPPDVISQILLAIPMWLLYEIGLFLSRHIKLKNTFKEKDQTPSA